MPGYCRHGAPAMASSAHRRRRSARSADEHGHDAAQRLGGRGQDLLGVQADDPPELL